MLAPWTFAAALFFAPPPPPSGEVPALSADAERGRSGLRLIDHHARESRRQRLVSGSIGLAVGGSQLGLGIYGSVELGNEGTGMRRAAAGQIVAGSLGFAGSLGQLIVPSSLERLQRSPAYRRLEASPGDAAALSALRVQWAEAARRARKRRLTLGGINIGLGALLVTAAVLRLAADDANSSEQTWAFTTLASAVGVTFAGVAGVLLPSESERSYAGLEAAQPRPKPHVSIAPSFGGMTVQARF